MDASITPPASAFETKPINLGSWKRTANIWSDQVVRLQYALQVLNLPIKEANEFSAAKHSGALQAEIKLWHHTLVKPELEKSTERSQLRGKLTILAEDVTTENFTSKAREVSQLQSEYGFPLLRREATDLSLGEQPVVGLLVGFYMLNSGNKIDGETLVRHGLRIFDEGHKVTEEVAPIVQNFRNQYPKRD